MIVRWGAGIDSIQVRMLFVLVKRMGNEYLGCLHDSRIPVRGFVLKLFMLPPTELAFHVAA